MSLGNFAYGGLQRSYSFDLFHADAIPFSVTAVQCPNVPCEQIWIQNSSGSSGNVTIGSQQLLVTGQGIVLRPGETTGWIPINNLNKIWHKDTAGSHLNYMIVR